MDAVLGFIFIIIYLYLFVLPIVGVVQVLMAVVITIKNLEVTRPKIIRYWLMTAPYLILIPLLYFVDMYSYEWYRKIIEGPIAIIILIIIPSMIAIYFFHILKIYSRAEKS